MTPFSKYHGTGNDFIIIDNRQLHLQLSAAEIGHLCHRRFGIGADGLILLQKHAELDFEMIYYNSDGNPSTMCGNGGRCIAAFAADLGVKGQNNLLKFMAVDGYHEAGLIEPIKHGYQVDLKMQNVSGMQKLEKAYVINTGSPHYIMQVEDVDKIDLVARAREIRFSEAYKKEGININFIQQDGRDIKVRTYERGVEDETWSCGTGVVASAIASWLITGFIPAHIHTKGGLLRVHFIPGNNNEFTDVHLVGPAVKVFEGDFV